MKIIANRIKNSSVHFLSNESVIATLSLTTKNKKYSLNINNEFLLISSDGLVNQEFNILNKTTHDKWEYVIPSVFNLIIGSKRILRTGNDEYSITQIRDQLEVHKDDNKIGTVRRRMKYIFFFSHYELELDIKYQNTVILAASLLILGIEKFGWLNTGD